MAACVLLVAFALATLAAWVAAWHRSDVLETFLPTNRLPDSSSTLVNADMWFGNTMGVRNALLVAVAGVGIVWLYSMRGLADAVWPEGQRRHRAWLVLGWLVPIGNFFVPKMIVNDLWAATEPNHRRGNVLLWFWWISCLMGPAGSGMMFRSLPHATHVSQAMDQMSKAQQGDTFLLASALLSLAVVWKLGGRLEQAARAVPSW